MIQINVDEGVSRSGGKETEVASKPMALIVLSEEHYLDIQDIATRVLGRPSSDFAPIPDEDSGVITFLDTAMMPYMYAKRTTTTEGKPAVAIVMPFHYVADRTDVLDVNRLGADLKRYSRSVDPRVYPSNTSIPGFETLKKRVAEY